MDYTYSVIVLGLAGGIGFAWYVIVKVLVFFIYHLHRYFTSTTINITKREANKLSSIMDRGNKVNTTNYIKGILEKYGKDGEFKQVIIHWKKLKITTYKVSN